MKYKAIALDLDGTLTDHNKKLPAENIKAVDKAIDMGIKAFLFVGAISAFGLFLNRRNKYRK